METRKRTPKPSTNKNERRRGRPAGKNRVPLSIEERRARNAQYERERRNETSEAMIQLAEAAGCDRNIANAELLATVINQLQRREKRPPSKHSLDDLQRINDNLESQIALLEKRLKDDPNFNADDLDQSDSDSSSSSSSESDTNSDSDTSESKRPAKRRKTSKTNTVHKTKSTNKRIQYETTSSSNSQDSIWSQKQSDNAQQDTDSTPQPGSNRSSVLYSPESMAAESHDDQPEVNLAFQLVPNNTQEDASGHEQSQSETTNTGPFDETENRVLDCLEPEDYVFFGTDAGELKLDWPLSDFNEFLSNFC